ncbi:MAG: sigma-54-dependent Fis family transcriptional regulator [Acidobacteria bacterium]|nr:MAG: sigma-54-dependent Fis family transcriptional regulator [Acidobacteriota bacterium]
MQRVTNRGRPGQGPAAAENRPITPLFLVSGSIRPYSSGDVSPQPNAPSFPHSSEASIAVVTTDPVLRRRLVSLCREEGHEVTAADDPERVLDLARSGRLDIVLLDATPPGGPLPRLLPEIARLPDGPAPLLIAPPAGPKAIFDLLDAGAQDVLHRPPHPLELRLRIRQVLDRRDLDLHVAGLEEAITERSRRSFSTRQLVSASPAMQELVRTLDRVAKMRTTVLIRGESGVGKELVARAIHFRSPRLEAPFIPINCAALPPHLIESELFGHERGAFTGAVSRRAGKFELAHRGTLFLDEVAETDLPTQAKLLRVLEQQEFMRVGGTKPVRVDVRLVAATNADLERLVREGRFREDLYYRLKVVTLVVPPLRERREDIPELASSILDQICRRNGLPPRRLTAAALDRLCAYGWPGNVRELMNTLEAVVVATPATTIDVEHLPPPLRDPGAESGAAPAQIPVDRSLREIEAEAIRAALMAERGSRTRAAARLGIAVRTLRRRIRALGLDRELPARPGRPRSRSSSTR